MTNRVSVLVALLFCFSVRGDIPTTTYTLENAFGDFSWDVSGTGIARYIEGGVRVQRSIKYVGTLSTEVGVGTLQPGFRNFFMFGESEPKSDGRTRTWLFERMSNQEDPGMIFFSSSPNWGTIGYAGTAWITGETAAPEAPGTVTAHIPFIHVPEPTPPSMLYPRPPYSPAHLPPSSRGDGDWSPENL